MIWTSILVAFVIALVITLVLVGLLGWRRPGARADEPSVTSVLFFVTILFLATWAIGMWITPYGPLVWGIPWVGWLLLALLVSLLVGVASPQVPRGARHGAQTTDTAEVVAEIGFGVMFWALIVALLAVALFGSWKA